MRPSILVGAVTTCIAAVACEATNDSALIALATGSSGTADIQLAQEEVGEIPGVRIRFMRDTLREGTDTETELARAYWFLEHEDLIGLVGHPGSRGSLVVAPLYNEAGVVQIVPSGTSRALQDAGPWTFTLAPNDSVEGAALAEYADEVLGAATATIFFVTDEYGYGLRDGVAVELEERGVEILDLVPVRTMYQLSETGAGDLESLAQASMDRGRPDVVILAARDFTAQAVIPPIAVTHPEVRFLAGDGVLLSRAAQEALRDYLDRLYLTLFWNPFGTDSLSVAYRESYLRISGGVPTHDHALYRDALFLLAEAVGEVGANSEKVREYMLSLGRDRPPFPGVTGPVSFTPDRAYPVFIVRADSVATR